MPGGGHADGGVHTSVKTIASNKSRLSREFSLDEMFSFCSHGAWVKRLHQSEATLVYALDTLGYAKRLRDKGVPPDQAEAHAEAARDFIMVELVTKADLNEALERWSLKLSVRLGFMLAAGIAALGAIVKLS